MTVWGPQHISVGSRLRPRFRLRREGKRYFGLLFGSREAVAGVDTGPLVFLVNFSSDIIVDVTVAVGLFQVAVLTGKRDIALERRN